MLDDVRIMVNNARWFLKEPPTSELSRVQIVLFLFFLLGDISPVSVFSISPTLQLLLLHPHNLYGKGEPVERADWFPSDWSPLRPASGPSFGKLMQGLPRAQHIPAAPGARPCWYVWKPGEARAGTGTPKLCGKKQQE